MQNFLLRIWSLVVFDTASILFLLGLTAIKSSPVWGKSFLEKTLELGPHTEAFEAWRKPNTPIAMDVYFYNWTNPEDIYNTSIKPKFVEMGPYRFKQFKEKTNITWNSNETITYQYLKNFYFDGENSPGHDSDVITTLNMVALSVAHMAKDLSFLLKYSFKLMLSTTSSNIYIQKTVRELLFEGYEDVLVSAYSSIPFLSKEKIDRFGWFYGSNGSVGADGVYNMATSADNNFGTLKRWNYDSKTPFYKDNCGKVSGSAGELYPRDVTPTKIQFFSAQMCRTVQFNFESNVTVKGVSGYKFSPGAEAFDNGTEIKENICYCNGECLPSGIFNVSACRNGAPVYLSLPHFYQADSTYIEAVEGLHPVKEKHEMYLILEPNTGVIADTSTRIQINALLQPLANLTMFEQAPNIMFPIFWFEQKAEISDELAANLTTLFNLPDM